METPFLEIPEGHFPLDPGGKAGKSGTDLGDPFDPFDISYILELTETAGKQDNSGKYIIFKLDEETFGVSLNNVLEVCRALPVTALPNVPGWLAGIGNLRGSLLAVIDLQAADEKTIPASQAKIIVLIDRQRQTSIGLLVDQVLEISFLPSESFSSFQPPKTLSARSFASGKAPYKDTSLLVFDTQKLFSSAEFDQVREH